MGFEVSPSLRVPNNVTWVLGIGYREEEHGQGDRSTLTRRYTRGGEALWVGQSVQCLGGGGGSIARQLLKCLGYVIDNGYRNVKAFDLLCLLIM